MRRGELVGTKGDPTDIRGVFPEQKNDAFASNQNAFFSPASCFPLPPDDDTRRFFTAPREPGSALVLFLKVIVLTAESYPIAVVSH